MKYNNDEYNPEDYNANSIHYSRKNSPNRKRRTAPSRSEEQSSSHRRDDAYAPDPYEKPASRPTANAGISSKGSGKREKRSKRKKLFKRIFQIAVILCIVLAIIGIGMCVGMYAAVSTEMKDMNIENLALNYSSFIYYYDENGQEQQLEQISGGDNRIWVNSEQISDNLKKATVAIEDQRFYSHHGFDLKRTLGATAKWMLSKIGIGSADYGGSTITQQVIKNITQEDEKSPTRKLKEILRAIALEKQLSKDQILTMYLNVVFFANNCNGVEAASNRYYNKSASELSIPEAAAITGITQRPAYFDPYVHPDNTLEKRNRVLGKMYELEMISESEYNNAINTPLNITKNEKKSSRSISTYFAEAVYNDVLADLQNQKGYSKEFATQQLTNGGLRIYCTMDTGIQDAIDRVYHDKDNFPSSSAQSAMVVMDPYNGEIKGLTGGMGEKTENSVWNRATQAKRQPGSAFKPIAVYAPALDTGKIDSSTVLKDEEIEVGHDNWKPKNSYDGFKGDMIVKECVGRSANIPAVKVLDMIGLSTSFDYAKNRFHIDTIVDDDKNYSSLSLGGLTQGATVKAMAGAYAPFVNGGKYLAPHTYTKVTDHSGKTVLDNTPSESQAISPAAAYIMSDLLYAVVNDEYGTGTKARLSNMPTYGKTGTTNENYDKWFVGYTPYYVGAVWYGYDQPKTLSGSNPAPSVWKQVMTHIHSGLDKKELEMPSTVVSEEVCTISGNLAKSGCPSDTLYYLSGKQPKKVCSSHKAIASSERPKSSATAKSTSKASASPKGTADPDEDQPDRTTPPTKTPSGHQTSPPERTEKPTQTSRPSENRPSNSGPSGGGNSEPSQTKTPEKSDE